MGQVIVLSCVPAMGFNLSRRFGAALVCYYGLFMTCALLVQGLDRDSGRVMCAHDRPLELTTAVVKAKLLRRARARSHSREPSLRLITRFGVRRYMQDGNPTIRKVIRRRAVGGVSRATRAPTVSST